MNCYHFTSFAIFEEMIAKSYFLAVEVIVQEMMDLAQCYHPIAISVKLQQAKLIHLLLLPQFSSAILEETTPFPSRKVNFKMLQKCHL